MWVVLMGVFNSCVLVWLIDALLIGSLIIFGILFADCWLFDFGIWLAFVV